jgi:hypothetical protein
MIRGVAEEVRNSRLRETHQRKEGVTYSHAEAALASRVDVHISNNIGVV